MGRNKAIIATFLAASCVMPLAALAFQPPQAHVPEKSQDTTLSMTPEKRASIVSIAQRKLDRANDPANAGLEAWSMLRYVRIYLDNAQYDLNSDEGYKALGMSKTQFDELLDKHITLVLPQKIDQMRNPSNKGLDAIGAVDWILYAVGDLQLTRQQNPAEILHSFGTTMQEIEKATTENARLAAQQILESVKFRDIEGADGWTALIEMQQFMRRAHLDPRTNAGFQAINSSLGEYQQLKRKNAILAVTRAWEIANQPEHAGEDAVYYLDLVETYLKRAGFNTGRGEGFSEIKTTREEFQSLVEKHSQHNNMGVAQPLIP